MKRGKAEKNVDEGSSVSVALHQNKEWERKTVGEGGARQLLQ